MIGVTESAGITLEAIKQGMEASELISGRNDLYVTAEQHLDRPVTWSHFRDDGALDWQKTLSAKAYRLWRMRGFKNVN